MASQLPPLGAFLRPIGLHRWGYTLRVVRHFDPEEYGGRPCIEYERWGIRDGRPVDDGEVRKGYHVDLVPTLLPGVWRCPPATPDDGGYGDRDSYRYATPAVQQWETYYRLIACDAAGQLELFQ